MELFKKGAYTINLRPAYEGRTLKPNVETLQGQMVRLQMMYRMDEGDNYPGEFVMSPADEESKALFTELQLAWIASGDVTPM